MNIVVIPQPVTGAGQIQQRLGPVAFLRRKGVDKPPHQGLVIHGLARRGLPRARRQFEDQAHQGALRESPLRVARNPRGKGSVLRNKPIQRSTE